MTLEQFLVELRKVSGAFMWDIGPLGRIRARDGYHCPLTAVCEAMTGEKLDFTDYPKAAELIGLPLELAKEIVVAADIDLKSPQHPLAKEATELRKRLLKALELGQPDVSDEAPSEATEIGGEA